MKAAISMLVLMALLLACASSLAQGYWQETPEGGLACRESRPGCHLLQMVMAGSFSQLHEDDGIGVRVFSAVLPQLCGLQDADFAHFTAQFDVEEDVIRRAYHIALGNCLYADILHGTVHEPDAAAVRRVLLLFLHPMGEQDADAHKAIIRAEMNESILANMADISGLPAAFIQYLIEHDDWQTLASN